MIRSLKALNILNQNLNKKIQLICTGSKKGAYEYLTRLRKELGCQNEIRFLGYVPTQHMPALYRNACALVFPSLFEGFGLPVVESMACGCPVITSNVSCLPETAGDAAILCSPEDYNELGTQINNVVENESLRNELIHKGKERAQLFHPEYFSKKMISLYAEL